MIRIHRPSAIPATLADEGPNATAAFLAQFDAAPNDYLTGATTFDFDTDIYGAEDVKETLRAAQHDKCCFCEAKVPHISYGDIEHFRPKAALREEVGGPLLRPGYYWLASEWTNLLYCCELCNRSGKGTYFPLSHNRRTGRCHTEDISKEKPRFVNPADEEPSKHFVFREEFVHFRTARGEVTRDALDLNRVELVERRRSELAVIKLFLDEHAHHLGEIKSARKRKQQPAAKHVDFVERIERLLRAWQEDSGEYAAMVRAYLRARRFRFTTTA